MIFTQHQKNALLKNLENAIAAVKDMPITQSCMDCQHSDKGGVKLRCALWDAYPPEDVKKKGCESYVFNSEDIPF